MKNLFLFLFPLLLSSGLRAATATPEILDPGDATLSSLMTTLGPPTSTISTSQTDYYLRDAAYAESTIMVTPYLSNPNASMLISINDGTLTNIANGQSSNPLPLGFGDNTIKIVVTPQGRADIIYRFMVRRIRSSDASLSDIITTLGRPTSSISPLQSDYFLPNAAYSESWIIVRPSLSNENASMQVRIGTEAFVNIASGTDSDKLMLAFGDNTIEIRVTAQDQLVRTYRFLVRRNLSSDASLSDIMTTLGRPTSDITPLQSNYLLPNAASSENSIIVRPYLSNENASMQVRIGTEAFVNIASGTDSDRLMLGFGDNTIEIRVTAQDQLVRTYRFLIRRNLSSDATLSWLYTSTGDLNTDFNPNQGVYTLDSDLDYSETSIRVTPTLSDENASMQVRVNNGAFQDVESGNDSDELPLIVGDNTIEIAVRAQDGLTNNYLILVHRKRSSDADLSAIMISAGTLSPTFSAEVSTYTMHVVNSTTSIKMIPTLANPDAMMEIKINDGQYVRLAHNTESDPLTLKVGENTVLIRITFPDGPSPARNARVAAVTTIYEFIVTRDNALPVTLISFTGKKSRAAQTMLNWVTADEKDFLAFEVQKSADAKSFEKVGNVTAKQANGSYLNAYTFYDGYASEPAIYYRLKMIDTDGSFTFSRIISIDHEAETGVVGEFYPNPVLTENVSVDIVTAASGVWKISAVDILGIELHLADKALTTGVNKVSIPVRSLRSGINLIKFENSGKAFIRRMIRF